MKSTRAAPELHRPTQAVIDLAALRANFELLRALRPAHSFFCPMVKANAYGHGDIAVTRELRAAGAVHIGVALIEEGQSLRAAGDSGEILIFGTALEKADAQAWITNRLTPVIGDWRQLECLEQALGANALGIHIEFDTGMSRMGFAVSDAARLRAWLDQHPQVSLRGLNTHFLRGEDLGLEPSISNSQMQALTRAVSDFRDRSVLVHALNSSGLVAAAKRSVFPTGTPIIGGRPGIALYGAQPARESELQTLLRPVLSWQSRLVRLHRLSVGETVSYNATWRASRPSLIGVIPAGYADGYWRALSNRGSVLVRGRHAPVTGTVCMDYFMVDLTDIENETRAHEGEMGFEDVILLGEQRGATISAQAIADLCDTITYEVFTRISGRVPRSYVNAHSSVGPKQEAK